MPFPTRGRRPAVSALRFVPGFNAPFWTAPGRVKREREKNYIFDAIIFSFSRRAQLPKAEKQRGLHPSLAAHTQIMQSFFARGRAPLIPFFLGTKVVRACVMLLERTAGMRDRRLDIVTKQQGPLVSPGALERLDRLQKLHGTTCYYSSVRASWPPRPSCLAKLQLGAKRRP